MITATDAITVEGENSQGFFSGIFSQVASGAKGNSGGITIDSDSLSVRNGATLNASTSGIGDAGTIVITATDAIIVEGKNSQGFFSGIFSEVTLGAKGNSGGITIDTGSLSLRNEARLNTRTSGVGNAGNITISSDSLSLKNSGLLTETFGQGNAGSLFIQAQDSVSVKDNSGIITSVIGGVGKGGDININAGSLSIEDGSQLSSSISINNTTQSAGRGDAGNINIDVTDAVTIAGVNRVPSGLFSLVSEGGVGNGGKITISANSFSLLDGANIFANTNGQGNGGTIQINANDSVTISGTSPTRGDSSEISTRTNSSNRGGDVIINTRDFNLSNGGVVNAQTVNDGNGGDILVNARQVEVINGGQLLSDTSGRGNAGKITVNATDQVIVDGIDVTLNDRIARFGTSRGIINTLENGASGFFVTSQGSGSAGNIEVTSPKIQLDNQGRLFADSASGNGGSIRLQVGDLLLLRRSSAISTSAGTAQAGGNGGNIDIDAQFILAFPTEDSDITANAFEGNGGNISITAEGLFGIAFREKPTILSDITASSEFGLAGTVDINTPEIDPDRGLVTLPEQAVDTEVALGCDVDGEGALAFYNLGRGGRPASPDDFLTADTVIGEWLPLAPSLESFPEKVKLSSEVISSQQQAKVIKQLVPVCWR